MPLISLYCIKKYELQKVENKGKEQMKNKVGRCKGILKVFSTTHRLEDGNHQKCPSFYFDQHAPTSDPFMYYFQPGKHFPPCASALTT